MGVKVIATNDFHYLTREDAPVQDVVMCIGTNSKIDDPNRIRMEGSELYMKTEEEMRALFPYCPEACDNTVEIAEKCNVEHYLTREDAPVQDVVMCIGTNSKIDDPNRIRMEGSEFYMKTEEEMRALFPYCPEACDNTVEIAEKCNVELDWDSIILPNYRSST